MSPISNQSGLEIADIKKLIDDQGGKIEFKGQFYTVSLINNRCVSVRRSNRPGFLTSLIEFFTHRLFEGTLKSRSVRLYKMVEKQIVEARLERLSQNYYRLSDAYGELEEMVKETQASMHRLCDVILGEEAE